MKLPMPRERQDGPAVLPYAGRPEPAPVGGNRYFRETWLWRSLGLVAVGLLILGVAGVVFIAWATRCEITLIIDNQSAAPIQKVEFYIDGQTFVVSGIAAGTRRERTMTLRGGGPMRYTVFSAARSYPPGEAAPYLDTDCRGARVGLRIDDAAVTRL